jgi:hypothetical protein
MGPPPRTPTILTRNRSRARGPDRLRPVDLEEQYAVGLGVLSIILLLAGVGIGTYFRTAPARIVRTVFPIAALLTLAAFGTFVAVARQHVKG